jgi:hypothetical protein
MCYTVIWLDYTTNQPYYSQEIANPDKSEALNQIKARSKTCRVLAIVPGHHGVFFNAEGLTDASECAILDTKSSTLR